MLEFSDGMKFDLEAPLHVERRRDGWYIVGNGMLSAVNSEAEGLAKIELTKKKNPLKGALFG